LNSYELSYLNFERFFFSVSCI